jgi:gliding motility-associated-like protein
MNLKLIIFRFSLIIITMLGIMDLAHAGGGGCTPANLIPCSTPAPVCSDPVFNAGSGGSINCATATPISMPGCQSCISGTTVNSQDLITTDYPGCGSVDGMVWFTFVAPDANNTFTVTPGTLQNAIIVVSTQPCGSGSFNACNSATGSNSASTTWGLSPGQQAWIGVGSTSETHGTFNLCVVSLPPTPGPGNTCATGNVICETTGFNYPMNCATASGTFPSCFIDPPQQDTWIVFTVLQSGTIAWTGDPNANAEFDWALWNITSGCPGTLLSCNYEFAGECGENFGMGTAGGEFNGTLTGTAGQTYAIQIDNFSQNGVGFNFTWQGTAVITPTAGFTMNNNFSCAGSLVVDFTHTGVGNAIYNFGNGNTYTGNNPPDQTYGPGSYAVTATAAVGACSDIQTSFITVYEPVSAVVTPVAASCSNTCNGSATVTSVSGGDGIYTYLWSNGSTSNTISNVCPGNYSVTVSNATCGTSAVVNTTIGVANPLPTVTGVVNGGTYCQGDVVAPINVNVTGSANWTVNYTLNGTPQTASGSTSPISLGSAAGTYTVTGVTDNFCTNTATGTQTIVINPLPTASISGGASYCPGDPITNMTVNVTGTGPWTVNYTLDGSAQTASGSSSPISLGNTPGVYVLTGVQDALCSNTASGTQTITVNPTPVITLTPTDPATCNGSDGSILVSGTGTGNVIWSGTSSSNANGVSLNYTISNLTAGTYDVYFVDGATGCQSATVSTTLLNANGPTLTVSNPPAVCSPATVDLTASASTDIGTISYYTDPTYTTLVSDPTAVGAGTYYVVADNAGCTDEGTITVVVNPTPVADPSTTTPVLCAGETVVLNATSVTGGTYSWSGPNSFVSTTQDPQITNATTAASGTYTLTVTANGCTSAPATVDVLVNPIPVATAGTTTPSVCVGADIALTGNATSGTYSWSGPNGFSSTDQNPVISPSTLNNSGTYTLTITADGCVSLPSNVSVTVNPLPVIDGGEDVTVCEGTTVVLSGSGGVSYVWTSDVVNGAPFTPALGSIVYTVTGTDANGCVGTDNVTVNVVPVPNADLSADVTYGVPPLTVTFTNSSTDATSYAWNLGNGNTFNTTATGTEEETYGTEGVYTIVLTASNGICSDLATVIVTVESPAPIIHVPNVFSPNGDGSNDVFFIDNMYLSTLNVKIFNRWGNLMYEITDPAGTWDGNTPDGKEASDGVYFFTYVAVGINQTELSGHGNVTLVR